LEEATVIEESMESLDDILRSASLHVKESFSQAKTSSAPPRLQPRLRKIEEGGASKLIQAKRLVMPEKIEPVLVIEDVQEISTNHDMLPTTHMLTRVERHRYVAFVCSKQPLMEFLSFDGPKLCPICRQVDPIKWGTMEGRELF
jgi:hypothetical protein